MGKSCQQHQWGKTDKYGKIDKDTILLTNDLTLTEWQHNVHILCEISVWLAEIQ